MSTKGTPRQTFRLPGELAQEIDLAIRRRNLWHSHKFFLTSGWRPPWNVSSFIITAIREKLAKMERSRRPRGCQTLSADSTQHNGGTAHEEA